MGVGHFSRKPRTRPTNTSGNTAQVPNRAIAVLGDAVRNALAGVQARKPASSGRTIAKHAAEIREQHPDWPEADVQRTAMRTWQRQK